MPLALRESSVPASRIEALRARRARLDDEIQLGLQNRSVPDYELREKKKLKLKLRDEEEQIIALS